MAYAVNQASEAAAPMLPASKEVRQARKIGPRPVRQATQPPRPMDCRVCAISTPQAPATQGATASPSAKEPPRKPMVEMANPAPASSPYMADLLHQARHDSSCPWRGNPSSSTPRVATTMASTAMPVGNSCSSTTLNRPTWSTSVFERVTATAKLRSCMARSSAAVAKI